MLAEQLRAESAIFLKKMTAASCAVVYRAKLLRFSVCTTSRSATQLFRCKTNIVVAMHRETTLFLSSVAVTCPMVQVGYTPQFGL